MKAVVGTCPCPHPLDHLNCKLFICGSHSQNQDEFTVRFILRQKFIFLFFAEAVRIWSLCEFSWSFRLQSGIICFQKFYFRKQISLPINEGSCWNLLWCYFSWLFGFQIVVFGSHSRNQDVFTVRFILRQKFIILLFAEAIRIWSLCEFSWSFRLQSFCCQVFCLVFLSLSFLSCSVLFFQKRSLQL